MKFLPTTRRMPIKRRKSMLSIDRKCFRKDRLVAASVVGMRDQCAAGSSTAEMRDPVDPSWLAESPSHCPHPRVFGGSVDGLRGAASRRHANSQLHQDRPGLAGGQRRARLLGPPRTELCSKYVVVICRHVATVAGSVLETQSHHLQASVFSMGTLVPLPALWRFNGAGIGFPQRSCKANGSCTFNLPGVRGPALLV